MATARKVNMLYRLSGSACNSGGFYFWWGVGGGEAGEVEGLSRGGDIYLYIYSCMTTLTPYKVFNSLLFACCVIYYTLP